MANSKSAAKSYRQSERRRERNSLVKQRIAWLRKKYRQAVEAKDREKANEFLPKLQAALDRAVGKGVLKQNTVSRLKSRAVKKLPIA
jgi:small subunit ribosomal protein S20